MGGSGCLEVPVTQGGCLAGGPQGVSEALGHFGVATRRPVPPNGFVVLPFVVRQGQVLGALACRRLAPIQLSHFVGCKEGRCDRKRLIPGPSERQLFEPAFVESSPLPFVEDNPTDSKHRGLIAVLKVEYLLERDLLLSGHTSVSFVNSVRQLLGHYFPEDRFNLRHLEVLCRRNGGRNLLLGLDLGDQLVKQFPRTPCYLIYPGVDRDREQATGRHSRRQESDVGEDGTGEAAVVIQPADGANVVPIKLRQLHVRLAESQIDGSQWNIELKPFLGLLVLGILDAYEVC